MRHTYGEVHDSVFTNIATFYMADGGEAPGYDLSYSYSSGGLISRASDLAQFGQALLSEKIVPEAERALLFEEQKTTAGQSTGYALGWYTATDARGRKVWFHPGELPSTGSILAIYPEQGISLAVLTNSPILWDSHIELPRELSELLSQLGK